MAEWASGYVTDVEYTHGFYRELTPNILTFGTLVKSLRGPSLGGGPQAFCELGCGQGFSTNLLAAANPGIDFYATDFNPAQIAGAQHLAREAGTSNVHFFDDSFADFEARTDLPQFDFIVFHGIYSWIAAEHRRTIVRFIDRRLKPGGLVYISYNCLPGWSGAAPFARLLRMASEAGSGTIMQKLDSGFAFVDRMQEANASYFAATLGIKERIAGLKDKNRRYVAHEYMNANWTPFYHADVAGELSAARLSFVGSAYLLDDIDTINLTPAQRAILAETSDQTMRETLRDFMVNAQFRRDLFSRGAVGLAAGEAKDIWLDSLFALSVPRDEVKLKIKGALGEADLKADVYAPIIDAFARPVEDGKPSALSLRQVLSEDQKLIDLGWKRLQQAVLALVAANYLQPCAADASESDQRRESAERFNRAVTKRARYSDDLYFLASPVTGGGVGVDRVQQLFLLALGNRVPDPAAFVWNTLSSQGQKLGRDGKPLETAEENLAELRVRYEAFENRLPSLRALGIL